MEREPLSLTTLVADTATGLADAFTEADITLHTDLAAVHVDGDPVRLRQIVTNQLTNALKFVPAGGTVTLTLHQEDGWAVLSVADTGPGIPDDELPRIFEPLLPQPLRPRRRLRHRPRRRRRTHRRPRRHPHRRQRSRPGHHLHDPPARPSRLSRAVAIH